MKKEIASRILDATLSLDKGINKIDSLISQIEDEKEKKEFVVVLGNIMQLLTRDIVFRINREFPELDPDK